MKNKALSEAICGAEEVPPHDYDDDLLESCPVTPLGTRGGIYYFLTPSGELRDIQPREMSVMGLVSLFDGDREWLITNFAITDKRGDKTDKFDTHDAGAWLMKACTREGLYDASMPVRGPGVWRDAETRSIVLHCGDMIYRDGEWSRSGQKIGEAIYPAAPRLRRPAAEPAKAAAGERLRAALGRWYYEDPLGPDLIMGWIGQAMLGGALDWRAHIMVTGTHGCGKSELAALVEAVMGPAAHPPANNYTEASLRQSLTGESRAMVLDESEHEEGGGRVQAVIELLRQMSQGSGARILRGSAGGKAQEFTVTGAAYLSSILHVPLKPQDKSRITLVRLKSLPAALPDNAQEMLRADVAYLAKQATALWRRAVDGYQVYQDCFHAWRGLFAARGMTSRQADQVATLLAGRDVLLRGGPPDAAEMEAEFDRCLALMLEAYEQDEDGEGEQCLNHLYTSPLDFYRGGEKLTVSQAITDQQNKQLEAVGLKVVAPGSVQHGKLLVANRHNGLERIFAGTRWAGGAWAQALRYLDGAKASQNSVRFGGAKTRATELPYDYLPRNSDPSPHPIAGGDHPVTEPVS